MAEKQISSFDPVVPYATNDALDDYMANFLERTSIWSNLNATQKLALARQATLQIDQLEYIGRKVHWDQPRQFPRYLDMYSDSDAFHTPERLLETVGKACCEQAWYLAVNYATGRDPEGRRDHQDQGVAGHSRVGASENYDISVARRHPLCPAAIALLRSYLAKTGNMQDYEDNSWRFV